MTAGQVQLGPLGGEGMARFAHLVPELIRATGPVSYDYQFGTDGLLERLVMASWSTPDTLFCAACTTGAVENGDLIGIEIGFAGANFYAFKANLAPLAVQLIEGGLATHDEIAGLVTRARKASYLNAHVPDDVYYLHALSTSPRRRGHGVGKALLQAAITRARAAGFRELQLDVLADNPAVGFYTAMGLQILAEVHAPDLAREQGFPAEYRMAVAL